MSEENKTLSTRVFESRRKSNTTNVLQKPDNKSKIRCKEVPTNLLMSSKTTLPVIWVGAYLITTASLMFIIVHLLAITKNGYWINPEFFEIEPKLGM